MRALRSFAVRASLPRQVAPLERIARNLRWTWDARVVDLFRWVDPDAWERAGHDPVRMLGLVPRARWTELAEDGPFINLLANVVEDLDGYLDEPRWYQLHHAGRPLRCVAYFSPEFGLSEALPIYSGGLGVLAGDHLKAASDLGLPFVGVGLLYHQGYFRQSLNYDGWQQEHNPALEPHGMPLTQVAGDSGEPLRVEVDLGGRPCFAGIWRADVGRVPLFLLDCDVEENEEAERRVTDRLYPTGSEHRLRQEIILGIGGVRALEALGYDCDVFHMNEGHAGFLGLERIRRAVQGGLEFRPALEAVRASAIFTTHTPVPAGIDVYDGDLMRRYFESFAKEMGLSFDELMALGRPPKDQFDNDVFNMAVMGLRLAGRANGVSKLHGQVSRSMFASLWPGVPEDEAPITWVTNGVHTSTWLGPEMTELFNRRLAPGWAETGGARWDRINEVPDGELWRARERARERLVYFVRERLRKQLRLRGLSEAEAAWTEDVFDPGILTIGFARRFAMYKRGTLILSDPQRLKNLLLSIERPVQIVFAGKAHPADDGGKEMIRQLVHFASDPEVRLRIAFLEDYDMEVGRMLTQGVDLWLNNPRRPLEACGTSGMKAALNGALNCSILDGWWDEAYNGRNGWAIGTQQIMRDDAQQDRIDASSIYDLIERDIAPRFYDRSEGPVPRRWVERMKHSIASLGGFVTADRMLRDYVQKLYLPAARHGAELAAGGYARAKSLAEWKGRVRSGWSEVAVIEVEGDVSPANVGEERSVTAAVRLGRLSPDDIAVQAVHGRVGANGEITSPAIVGLRAESCRDGVCRFAGSITAEAPGLYGFAVRVLPAHPDLTAPAEMGLVVWA